MAVASPNEGGDKTKAEKEPTVENYIPSRRRVFQKDKTAFRHLTEHPRPHLPTSKIHPIHHPWTVDPHCSSAMQTTKGRKRRSNIYTRRNETTKPRNQLPQPSPRRKRSPAHPASNPTNPTPVPHRPAKHRQFKNRFPGPTGPLPKRTVRPSVSRAQPQPQQERRTHPANDWPHSLPGPCHSLDL